MRSSIDSTWLDSRASLEVSLSVVITQLAADWAVSRSSAVPPTPTSVPVIVTGPRGRLGLDCAKGSVRPCCSQIAEADRLYVPAAQRPCGLVLTLQHNCGVSDINRWKRRYQSTTRRRCSMLTPSTRLRLQEILRRIGHGDAVSLQERIHVQKHADRDPTVAGWLRQARRFQQQRSGDGIDRLLGQLNLGDPEAGRGFRPDPDDPGDLGDWFSQAPDWLRRS